MGDNFDLKKFLTENKLTQISQINEEEQDDDFNVTPDEKEWNQLDIGDIVTVDFKKDGAGRSLLQFTGIPFKIVGEKEVAAGSAWWVEPARAEDKQKWKEVKMKYNKNGRFSFWADQGWNTNKENVEPYED